MSDEMVMRLLAPLTSIYTARVAIEGHAPVPPSPARRVVRAVDGFELCRVEAVVTVDAKGRVPLRLTDNGNAGMGGIVSVTAVGTAMIRVTLGAAGTCSTWAVDARGRLPLHQGLMCAAGIAAGQRLVVVRLANPLIVLLTAPDNLAVHKGPE